MSDRSIPIHLHSGSTYKIVDGLGLFWSSVFSDGEFVDRVAMSSVCGACQTAVDLKEAVSARNHSKSSAYSREHWYPIYLRLSERDSAPVLRVGEKFGAVVGGQGSGKFRPGSVFIVGGTSTDIGVHTYPIHDTRVVGCRSCLTDSITSPTVSAAPGSGFSIEDGVLTVREEYDPFSSGNFLKSQSGDDSVATVWLCDAEIDNDNVSNFMGYPVGVETQSTEESRRQLAVLWDAIIFGLTPASAGLFFGSVFNVPVCSGDEVVEAVTDDAVVTDSAVYSLGGLTPSVSAGDTLTRGSVLVDELRIYPCLTSGHVAGMISSGELSSLMLPPGSIDGSDAGRVLQACDTGFSDIAVLHMSNVMRVEADVPMSNLIPEAYELFRRLVPAYGGVCVICNVQAENEYSMSADVESCSVDVCCSVSDSYSASFSSCEVCVVPGRPGY